MTSDPSLTAMLPLPRTEQLAELAADNKAADALWASHPRLVEAAKKAHFTTTERRVVYYTVERDGDKVFTDLLAEDWGKFYGIGKAFMAKIKPLGWIQTPDVFTGRSRCSIMNMLNLDARGLTRKTIKAAVKAGTIAPGKGRNFGAKAFKEVCDWLGIPVPVSGRQWKFDPYTGKPFKRTQQ